MELRGAAAGAPPRAPLLLLTYGLHGAGIVPPMVYLADLAARGRGLGVGFGALAWLCFGLGGLAGGVLSGRVVDRIGGLATLRLWLAVQVAALALTLPPWPALVLPAALAAGFAAIGVTTVTLSVTREVAAARAAALWVRCTAAFAVVQAGLGFALAALFAATGESHAAVFGVGLGFSLASLAAAVVLGGDEAVGTSDSGAGLPPAVSRPAPGCTHDPDGIPGLGGTPGAALQVRWLPVRRHDRRHPPARPHHLLPAPCRRPRPARHALPARRPQHRISSPPR